MRVSGHSLSHPVQMGFAIVRGSALGERLCPHPCSVTRFTPALCDQVLPHMRVSRHSLSHPVQIWFSIVSGSSLWVNDCVYTCSVDQVYTGVMRPGIIQHA